MLLRFRWTATTLRLGDSPCYVMSTKDLLSSIIHDSANIATQTCGLLRTWRVSDKIRMALNDC